MKDIISVCIQCFHLKNCPETLGKTAWCSEGVFEGSLPVNHQFLTSERACDEFEEDIPEIE